MKRNHRDLKAWREAIRLVEAVYKATESFPKPEQFGLAGQMRRAAVSVPANIAEGAARSGTKELLHFLSIARGSLSELDTHIEIGLRLGYLIKSADLQKQVDDIAGLLSRLSSSLRQRQE